MASNKNNTLHHHITAVKKGERVFENAFQGVSRMVLEGDIEKVLVNGKTTFDFTVFRKGKKHIIGMYEECCFYLMPFCPPYAGRVNAVPFIHYRHKFRINSRFC